MGVVYKITNTVNGKGYIGITSQALPARLAAHRYISRVAGDRAHALQKAIRKHGWEAFTVEVLAEHDDYEELKRLEREMIEAHGTYGDTRRGYNLTRGGDGCVGMVITDETRRRLSAAFKGRKVSVETRAKLSEVHKGRPVSDETRAKIAASLRGQKHAPERVEKLRAKRLGVKQSPDLVERRVAPLRGRKRTGCDRIAMMVGIAKARGGRNAA